MRTSLKQIQEQALGLNSEDRAKLAEVMLESLSSPLAEVAAAWAQDVGVRADQGPGLLRSLWSAGPRALRV